MYEINRARYVSSQIHDLLTYAQTNTGGDKLAISIAKTRNVLLLKLMEGGFTRLPHEAVTDMVANGWFDNDYLKNISYDLTTRVYIILTLLETDREKLATTFIRKEFDDLFWRAIGMGQQSVASWICKQDKMHSMELIPPLGYVGFPGATGSAGIDGYCGSSTNSGISNSDRSVRNSQIIIRYSTRMNETKFMNSLAYHTLCLNPQLLTWFLTLDHNMPSISLNINEVLEIAIEDNNHNAVLLILNSKQHEVGITEVTRAARFGYWKLAFLLYDHTEVKCKVNALETIAMYAVSWRHLNVVQQCLTMTEWKRSPLKLLDIDTSDAIREYIRSRV